MSRDKSKDAECMYDMMANSEEPRNMRPDVRLAVRALASIAASLRVVATGSQAALFETPEFNEAVENIVALEVGMALTTHLGFYQTAKAQGKVTSFEDYIHKYAMASVLGDEVAE